MSRNVAAVDLVRLRDMLDYALRAMEHVEGIAEPDFRRSRLHQDAVIRALSMVGEAANAVSPACRLAHPDLPWRLMTGMRHRLVHDYGGIALPVIRSTVRDDLPDLVTQLRAVLPPGETLSP